MEVVLNIRFYDKTRPESERIFMNLLPDKQQYNIILGLKNLRVKYSNEIIMGHLNINSIRNMLELLSSLIGGKIDILMISETKVRCNVSYESIFYSRIFNCVQNGSKYKGGWIILFVKDGIITFSLDRYFFPVGFEAFCAQLNLRKKKPFVFINLTTDSLNIIKRIGKSH